MSTPRNIPDATTVQKKGHRPLGCKVHPTGGRTRSQGLEEAILMT